MKVVNGKTSESFWYSLVYTAGESNSSSGHLTESTCVSQSFCVISAIQFMFHHNYTLAPFIFRWGHAALVPGGSCQHCGSHEHHWWPWQPLALLGGQHQQLFILPGLSWLAAHLSAFCVFTSDWLICIIMFEGKKKNMHHDQPHAFSASSPLASKGGREAWCSSAVWNLKAVIWFLFPIYSLVFLPSPVAPAVLSFSR